MQSTESVLNLNVLNWLWQSPTTIMVKHRQEATNPSPKDFVVAPRMWAGEAKDLQ